jgi:hypothetical protein
MKLDSSVRQISVQFSFSNPRFVPTYVRRVPEEQGWQLETRKSTIGGVQFIQPTLNCSILGFESEIESSGYELVDAFTQTRYKNDKPYEMVRFVFARREHVNISEEFQAIRDDIRADLQKICKEAMWRVRAYNNPYLMDDAESQERVLSINMEVREPLFEKDQPRTIWPKDQNGQRTGEPKVPLKPDRQLVIADGSIMLMPTDK